MIKNRLHLMRIVMILLEMTLKVIVAILLKRNKESEGKFNKRKQSNRGLKLCLPSRKTNQSIKKRIIEQDFNSENTPGRYIENTGVKIDLKNIIKINPVK